MCPGWWGSARDPWTWVFVEGCDWADYKITPREQRACSEGEGPLRVDFKICFMEAEWPTHRSLDKLTPWRVTQERTAPGCRTAWCLIQGHLCKGKVSLPNPDIMSCGSCSWKHLPNGPSVTFQSTGVIRGAQAILQQVYSENFFGFSQELNSNYSISLLPQSKEFSDRLFTKWQTVKEIYITCIFSTIEFYRQDSALNWCTLHWLYTRGQGCLYHCCMKLKCYLENKGKTSTGSLSVINTLQRRR